MLGLLQEYVEDESLLGNHQHFINKANLHREELSSKPSQSFFRVYALLVVKDDDERIRIIHGANCEPCFIGGSICAERSALVQLQRSPCREILSCYVVTDSAECIPPGLLCREFLSSKAPDEALVIMANNDGTKMTVIAMKDLHPRPFRYRRLSSREMMQFGPEWGKICSQHTESYLSSSSAPTSPCHPRAKELIEMAASSIHRDRSSIHPLQLSAAILLRDGTIVSSHMLKGIEYGCSIDPITQLIYELERDKLGLRHQHTSSSSASSSSSACCGGASHNHDEPASSLEEPSTARVPSPSTSFSSTPSSSQDDGGAAVVVVMMDQFGVLHAPFSQARALLTEHGHADATVLLHDHDDGRVVAVKAIDLVPLGIRSHDMFFEGR